MKDHNALKIDWHHAALQSAHWAGSASLWCYVTVLLLSLGFNNTYVGSVSAGTFIGAIVFQPILSSWVDRSRRLTSRCMALALTVAALAAAVLLWVFLQVKVAVTLSIVILGIALHVVPPFINAMVMDLSRRGVAVNYGLGRGIGSVSYAVFALVTGLLLEDRAPTLTIPIFLAAFLGQFVLLYFFRYNLPALPDGAQEQKADILSVPQLLKKYPAFTVLLLGCAFLQGSHNTLNTYLIHVMERVGAGEGLMGTLMCIAACAELPSMMFFNRIHKRISLKTLFRICSFGFLMKCTLFLLAQTPTLLYVACALQFLELGLFVPCTVCCVAEKLDSANQVKGQGLIYVCANGLGPAVISLVCGRMVDTLGVGSTLLFLCINAAVGCAVIWVATGRRLDKEVVS